MLILRFAPFELLQFNFDEHVNLWNGYNGISSIYSVFYQDFHWIIGSDFNEYYFDTLYAECSIFTTPFDVSMCNGYWMIFNQSECCDSLLTSYTDCDWLPTQMPTLTPTQIPTKLPTEVPTKNPTETPTKRPSNLPTQMPTHYPSHIPTRIPTKNPTQMPTHYPSNIPTLLPTELPSKIPSQIPTLPLTHFPSQTPTHLPSAVPTYKPKQMPSNIPTAQPSYTTTIDPTLAPNDLQLSSNSTSAIVIYNLENSAFLKFVLILTCMILLLMFVILISCFRCYRKRKPKEIFAKEKQDRRNRETVTLQMAPTNSHLNNTIPNDNGQAVCIDEQEEPSDVSMEDIAKDDESKKNLLINVNGVLSIEDMKEEQMMDEEKEMQVYPIPNRSFVTRGSAYLQHMVFPEGIVSDDNTGEEGKESTKAHKTGLLPIVFQPNDSIISYTSTKQPVSPINSKNSLRTTLSGYMADSSFIKQRKIIKNKENKRVTVSAVVPCIPDSSVETFVTIYNEEKYIVFGTQTIPAHHSTMHKSLMDLRNMEVAISTVSTSDNDNESNLSEELFSDTDGNGHYINIAKAGSVSNIAPVETYANPFLAMDEENIIEDTNTTVTADGVSDNTYTTKNPCQIPAYEPKDIENQLFDAFGFSMNHLDAIAPPVPKK